MKTPLLLSLVSIAAALVSCERPQQRAMAPPPPKVTVSHPQQTTVTNWDEFPGHLEAVEMVELRPRITGYLEAIHFEDGAEVKAGDLLFAIDPKPYQAELDRATAERQRAETHLELARNDLKRAEGLRGTRAISEEEYDSRSKASREAEAALAAAQAAESAARINVEYTRIKAPISGRIGRRLVTVGNLVQMQGGGGATTVLATINTIKPIYCYFDADERAFLRYRARLDRASEGGSLPCQLALANEQGFPHQGRIDFFDNQVNPRSGTIRLRAVFPNEDRSLMPGFFANVRLPAGPAAEALLIPDVAIGTDQGRKFVYVVNKEGKVEMRRITADRAHGSARAILSGLTPEDTVVVNGILQIRPGVKVEAQEATMQTPATEGPPSQGTNAPGTQRAEAR